MPTKNKAVKQTEFPGTPSPAIRNKMLEAVELRDAIGDQQERLVGALDDLRKMAREAGKKSLSCETDDGREVTMNLVSTGERAKLSIHKKKKEEVLPA